MAEETGKIYITITNKPITSGGGSGGGTGEGAGDKPKEDAPKKTKTEILGEYAQHQFFNLIEQQASQFVSYTIGNIGNFTGDYDNQRHIQEIVSTINVGKSLVMSAIGGLKATGGNPIGALVGLGVATASMGVNAFLGYTTAMASNQRQNYSIAQLKEISGLDTLSNGSR